MRYLQGLSRDHDLRAHVRWAAMYNLHVLPLSFLTQSKLMRQWVKGSAPDEDQQPAATVILQALHSALASSREEVQVKLMAEGEGKNIPYRQLSQVQVIKDKIRMPWEELLTRL